MRIILGTDDLFHLDYLPLASAAWRKFFPEYKINLAIVSNGQGKKFEHKDYWAFCERWVDEMFVFNKPPSVEAKANGNVGKISRLWLAGQFGDDDCSLHDIDYTPLQKAYYAAKYAQYKPGKIMIVGEEVYSGNPHEKGRFPMSGFTAKSNMIKEVANPNNLSFEDFYEELRQYIEGVETNPRRLIGGPDFSDERLLGMLFDERDYRKHVIHVNRNYDMLRDTIDRAKWMPDRKRLWREEYFWAHLQKIDGVWQRKRCNVIAEFLGIADEWQDGKHWTDITGIWDTIADPCPVDPNPKATAI